MIKNYPLAKVTSLGVGGPADFFVKPRSVEEIIEAQRFAATHNLALTIIGYGTNLLVRDGGIRGVVMQIAEPFAHATIKDTTLTAQAGCVLGSLSKFALLKELSGLEFAVGIPGGIGGATFMNAGAYGGEIGPLIKNIQYVQNGKLGNWDAQEFYYSYRSSRLQAEKEQTIVTEIQLKLSPGKKEDILHKMDDFQDQRRSKQPLEYASAGSTFKRPLNHYVGPLIEQANLKGYRIGGAEVSTKHAGFLVKKGAAQARDFLDLIEKIQEIILRDFGVQLEPEIRILGED